MTRPFILAAALIIVLCPAFAVLGQVDQQQPTQTVTPVITPVVTPVVIVNPPPPKTHLQAIAEQKGVLIVCGFTDVGTVQREDGSYVRVTAAQFTNTTTATMEYGLLVFIHQTDGGSKDTRSFVDADEVDSLLQSLDSMNKLDRTVTTLGDFDAKFRTRGDLEIANVDEAGVREVAFQGVEIISSSGQETVAATRFPLARLAEVMQYITNAKQIIDKAKENRQAAAPASP